MALPDGKAIMMLTLAQGSNLQEAARATMQKYGLTVVQSDQQTINGLNVLQVIADQPENQQQQSPALRTVSHFISYGDLIYHVLGVSGLSDFNNYSNLFNNTLTGFRQLTNQEIINRKPDRIKIITATQSTTLQQILIVRNERDAKKQNEIAILNGMTLSQNVPKGMMIKVISQ
jgi:predicted Zn-dependent protease